MSVSISAILNICEHADLSVSFWDVDKMISKGLCLPQHLCVIQGGGFYIWRDIPAFPALSTLKSLLVPLHAFALH